MTTLFLKIINMSISASWLALAIILLRLILKKAPKWCHVLLWGMVGIRLICPFSLESSLSLSPNAETIRPEIMMDREPAIDSGITILNNTVNPIISHSFTPDPTASANPLQIWIPVAGNLWLLGILVMLIYTAVSYWILRRKVATAILLQDNIFQSEQIASPFVLGIIRPRIYLPFHMNKEDIPHVIAHEQAHIHRKDHWWKPLGFLLLTLHWFNPLLWIAYVLLCRDIELACDEKAIKEMENEQRADYSQALLSCSVNRKIIAACPLAFGEVHVKERVKSVLNYKKPAFWIVFLSVTVCLIVAICFLTNPKETTQKDASSSLNNLDETNKNGDLSSLNNSDEDYLRSLYAGKVITVMCRERTDFPGYDFQFINLEQIHVNELDTATFSGPNEHTLTISLTDMTENYIEISFDPCLFQQGKEIDKIQLKPGQTSRLFLSETDNGPYYMFVLADAENSPVFLEPEYVSKRS